MKSTLAAWISAQGCNPFDQLRRMSFSKIGATDTVLGRLSTQDLVNQMQHYHHSTDAHAMQYEFEIGQYHEPQPHHDIVRYKGTG